MRERESRRSGRFSATPALLWWSDVCLVPVLSQTRHAGNNSLGLVVLRTLSIHSPMLNTGASLSVLYLSRSGPPKSYSCQTYSPIGSGLCEELHTIDLIDFFQNTLSKTVGAVQYRPSSIEQNRMLKICFCDPPHV